MLLETIRTKTVIRPFAIKGTSVKGVVPIGQLPHIFHTITFGVDVSLKLHLYNCGMKAQMLNVRRLVWLVFCVRMMQLWRLRKRKI